MSIETPFVITTNIEARSERAGDREILIVFEIPTASQEEMSLAEKMVRILHIFKIKILNEVFQYEKAMHSRCIPVGATIKYGSFVMTEGWH